jgi:hypothetical protein
MTSPAWIITTQQPDGYVQQVDFRRWLWKGRPLTFSEIEFKRIETSKSGRFELVEACFRSVLALQGQVSSITLASYTRGVQKFFKFLDMRPISKGRVTKPQHVTRQLLHEYLHWLPRVKAKSRTGQLSSSSVKSTFENLRHALLPLIRNGEISSDAFPENPFPRFVPTDTQDRVYSKSEMQRILKALVKDIEAVRAGKVSRISGLYSLVPYLLLIAALTGRNTTSLLDLKRDCLQPHPVNDNKVLLGMTKRRAGRHSQMAINRTKATTSADKFDIIDTVDLSVANLVREVLGMTEDLAALVPEDLKNYLWLIRDDSARALLRLRRITNFRRATKDFSIRHQLKDDSGQPLVPRISHFRQTMAVTIAQRLNKDPEASARIMGHSVDVMGRHYSPITEDMRKHFRFCGIALEHFARGRTNNKKDHQLVAKETNLPAETVALILDGTWNTGVGSCSDPFTGKYAPNDGDICTKFTHCFRCPNFVVVGREADLYRLFSFYWAIVRRRSAIGKKLWARLFRHVVRVIDNEISPMFDRRLIETARSRAFKDPHPMWRSASDHES